MTIPVLDIDCRITDERFVYRLNLLVDITA